MTIEMWAYWDGTDASEQVLMTKRNSWSNAQMRWEFAADTAGSMLVRSTKGTPAFGASLTQGVWQHLVITKADTTWTLYKDGSQAGSSVTCSVSNSATAGVHIGGATDTSISFNGDLDEVRVSSALRPISWIQTSYNNQSDPAGSITVGDEHLIGF